MPLELTIDPQMANLKQRILEDTAKHLKDVLYAMKTSVKDRVGVLIEDAINESPEKRELEDGILRAELGVEDGKGMVKKIIEKLKENVDPLVIEPKLVGEGIEGGMLVQVLREDFQELLDLPDATYESYSTRKHSPITVPWLEWLLTGGDGPIVQGYFYFTKIQPRYSRTEKGFMAKGSNRNWALSQYSGTGSDNWLTRAFKDLPEKIGNILLEEFKKRF